MIVEFITIVGVPVGRSICGWVEKAMADGKIETFEWKQLAETVLRTGIPGAALLWGFSLPLGYAVAIPLIVDYAYRYIKKLIEVSKFGQIHLIKK